MTPTKSTEQAAYFDAQREAIHRDMLSAVSHDLKTPLAAIIGALEVYERMKGKLPPDKQETLINTALHEAYRLDNFITNILDVGKLEGGMVKVRQEQTDVGHVIEDCIMRLGHRMLGVDIKRIAVKSHITITTDPMLLCRALSILLDNAVKYGGKPPVIRIEYGQEGNEIFLHIHDNGEGIPAGKREAIFDKYTRIAKQDHQNAGTGLGLAICRLLVQLLKGTVHAENHPQGGALFIVRLPME